MFGKSFLKFLTPGDSIRLRDDALPHVKIREWAFKGIDRNNTVLLNYTEQGYTLEVGEEDIDWETYRKTKERENALLDRFEKRQQRRKSLSLAVEYYQPNSKASHPGRMLNASKEGVSVCLPEKLEVGHNLKLRFVPFPGSDPIELLAEIVWMGTPLREGYRSGMKITQVTTENRHRLGRLLTNSA